MSWFDLVRKFPIYWVCGSMWAFGMFTLNRTYRHCNIIKRPVQITTLSFIQMFPNHTIVWKCRNKGDLNKRYNIIKTIWRYLSKLRHWDSSNVASSYNWFWTIKQSMNNILSKRPEDISQSIRHWDSSKLLQLHTITLAWNLWYEQGDYEQALAILSKSCWHSKRSIRHWDSSKYCHFIQ